MRWRKGIKDSPRTFLIMTELEINGLKTFYPGFVIIFLCIAVVIILLLYQLQGSKLIIFGAEPPTFSYGKPFEMVETRRLLISGSCKLCMPR